MHVFPAVHPPNVKYQLSVTRRRTVQLCLLLHKHCFRYNSMRSFKQENGVRY